MAVCPTTTKTTNLLHDPQNLDFLPQVARLDKVSHKHSFHQLVGLVWLRLVGPLHQALTIHAIYDATRFVERDADGAACEIKLAVWLVVEVKPAFTIDRTQLFHIILQKIFSFLRNSRI